MRSFARVYRSTQFALANWPPNQTPEASAREAHPTLRRRGQTSNSSSYPRSDCTSTNDRKPSGRIETSGSGGSKCSSSMTTSDKQQRPQPSQRDRSRPPAFIGLLALVSMCLLEVSRPELVEARARPSSEQRAAFEWEDKQQQQQQQQEQPRLQRCVLGNDTYQLGERWNPNLPPFGVQVCVLCECILKQRKSCYEAKVACRRIISECPIIDSCPDGKEPVTTAGQCCKSCQLTGPSSQQARAPLPEQTQSQSQMPDFGSLADQILYRNERIREYESIARSVMPCQKARDGERQHTSMNPMVKTLKGGKNDLNGIDTRIAFKSLHDAQSFDSYQAPSSRNRTFSKPTPDENLRLDHLHPNDVQPSTPSNNLQPQQNAERPQTRAKSGQQPPVKSAKRTQTSNTCLLGEDLFQVGDRWNPILPPFGVQVCVQCNCIVRLKKSCYEPRVTCRRVNNECPIIDLCPDGKRPLAIAGQCCKSCPRPEQPLGEDVNNNNLSGVIALEAERTQRIDRLSRESQSIMKSYPACTSLKRPDVGLIGEHNPGNNPATNGTVKRTTRLAQRL